MSEQSAPRSRRGRQEEEVAAGADISAQAEPTQPAHLARKIEVEQRKAAQAQAAPIEKWYEVLQGKKLMLVIRKKNGNTYRTYIGNVLKDDKAKEFAARAEKEGKLKRR